MIVWMARVRGYPYRLIDGSELQKWWAQGLERTSKSIFEIFWGTKQSFGVRGSPGGSSYENLESELVKSFHPNRREVRVPEYRRGVKDPNTTHWRRGPVSHTAMLVKQFFQRLDSTSAKELERGFPTDSRFWYQLVVPPIWPYTTHTRKCVQSRSGTHGKISQHNSRHKLKNKTSFILQARGQEGPNT